MIPLGMGLQIAMELQNQMPYRTLEELTDLVGQIMEERMEYAKKHIRTAMDKLRSVQGKGDSVIQSAVDGALQDLSNGMARLQPQEGRATEVVDSPATSQANPTDPARTDIPTPSGTRDAPVDITGAEDPEAAPTIAPGSSGDPNTGSGDDAGAPTTPDTGPQG